MRNYEFKLTPAYCLYNGIAVMKQKGSNICFIVQNPDDLLLKERITKAFNNFLNYVLKQQDCPSDYLDKPLIEFVGGNRTELRKYVSQLYSESEKHVEPQEKTDKQNEATEAAAVVLLDTLMADARARNATDIHIEKNIVRFRICGKLQFVTKLSAEKSRELVQRIKFLAGMNVLENRRNQDGHFVYGKKDIVFARVSTVGIVGGQGNDAEESVVIRLLDTKRIPLTLKELGFNELQYKKIKELCNYQNGLVIICGPTGAGKSTTAASILVEIKRNMHDSVKIVSIEDPPEYLIPGITQIKIDEKLDNSFSNALVHVFRQDPDVLMIGEIRDEKSAAAAVRAALTGHLVLATLHTSSAAEAVLRLGNLGIPYNLIVSVLKGVIVQDLHNMKDKVSLIADVSIPLEKLKRNEAAELTETALEELFEHNTNYTEVLENVIGLLKEKQSPGEASEETKRKYTPLVISKKKKNERKEAM